MKKIRIWLPCLLALCILTGVCPALSAQPQVILYTCYRQMGWGDAVQIGWVTDDGNLYLITGHDADLKWPSKPEEQLAWLRKAEAEPVDRLRHDDVTDLKGLVTSVPDQGKTAQPAACDAGTESSYAVRYTRSGTPIFVLLGMSGDDRFENTDPNAQALYLYLRSLFPQVTCYGGTMGPAGFRPVSLRSFCGLEGLDFTRARIVCYLSDCEEGNLPMEMTEEETEDLRRLLSEGMVTGKANASSVTGGFMICVIHAEDGKRDASLDFYDGLLMRPDGMYFLRMP